MGADSIRVVHPLFQAEGGGSIPTSALQLQIGVVDFRTAKQLNKLWHSRFPKLTSPQCRVAYAAEYDGLYYAVAIWSRPIARAIPQYEWLELQRFAIAPDAPPQHGKPNAGHYDENDSQAVSRSDNPGELSGFGRPQRNDLRSGRMEKDRGFQVCSLEHSSKNKKCTAEYSR